VNLTLTVLEIVAPVFILAAVGFTWVKLGAEYRVQFITQFAMTVTVPCLVFVALVDTKIDPSALTALSLAGLLGLVIISVIMAVLVWILGLDRRTFLPPMMSGNTGNLGLPLALFAFGDIGLSYAIVVFAASIIWSFSVGLWVVAGQGALNKVLKEPLIWATLLGLLFMSQNWRPPEFMMNAAELIGQMAIPMMLITLGVAVARLSVKRISLTIFLSLAKVLICAGIGWAVGLWFGLQGEAFGVLVLQLATPVAVTSYLMAEKYKADAQSVAGLVVSSTLLSVMTLPILLALLI